MTSGKNFLVTYFVFWKFGEFFPKFDITRSDQTMQHGLHYIYYTPFCVNLEPNKVDDTIFSNEENLRILSFTKQNTIQPLMKNKHVSFTANPQRPGFNQRESITLQRRNNTFRLLQFEAIKCRVQLKKWNSNLFACNEFKVSFPFYYPFWSLVNSKDIVPVCMRN